MARRSPGTVYLLHFDRPYQHARHYIGWTGHALEERLREHQCGRGARLLAVAIDAGISFVLARTWRGGRTLERRKKTQGGASRLCPICREAAGRRRPTAMTTDRPNHHQEIS